MSATNHTDPSFITLLLQDQLGRLQVMNENQWVSVHPIARGIVVNIGDLLHVYLRFQKSILKIDPVKRG